MASHPHQCLIQWLKWEGWSKSQMKTKRLREFCYKEIGHYRGSLDAGNCEKVHRRRIDMETCSYTLSHGWLGEPGIIEHHPKSGWSTGKNIQPQLQLTHYKLDLCLLRFDRGNKAGSGPENVTIDRSGGRAEEGKGRWNERANWHQNFDLQRAGPGPTQWFWSFTMCQSPTEKLVKVWLLQTPCSKIWIYLG